MDTDFETSEWELPKVIGMTSEYDQSITIELWGKYIEKNKDLLTTIDSFQLACGVVNHIQEPLHYSEFEKFILNNWNFILNRLEDCYGCISRGIAYFTSLTDLIALMIEIKEYDKAINGFQKLIQNKNKHERHILSWAKINDDEAILDLFNQFDDRTLDETALEILETWADQVKSKTVGAKINIILVQLEENIEYKKPCAILENFSFIEFVY